MKKLLFTLSLFTVLACNGQQPDAYSQKIVNND